MPIVVISYRQEYTHYRDYTNRHPIGGGDSNLDIQTVNNEEEAAEYIANRIKQDREAEYLHLVVDRWEDVIAAGRYIMNATYQNEESVAVPYAAPEDYKSDESNWNKYSEECVRKDTLSQTITKLVKDKLDDHK